MLTSTGGEDTSSGCNNNRTKTSLNRLSSSSPRSSSSTSTSPFSSPSPFSPLHHYHQTHKPKTMEEVWKDINLASLHDQPSSDQDLSISTSRHLHHHHHHHIHVPPHNSNFILQDFFSKPFNKDPPSRIVSSSSTTTITTTAAATGLFCSSPVPPPLATVLSLNSGPSFDILDNVDPLSRPTSHMPGHLHHNPLPVSNLSSFNSPFDAALDSSSEFPSFSKRRVQESDNSSCDRRHKRMIKNRESAARSRARKQAYTNGLELEVAYLLEENARLKRQQEELYSAAAAQLPKKRTLHRTSTAPF